MQGVIPVVKLLRLAPGPPFVMHLLDAKCKTYLISKHLSLSWQRKLCRFMCVHYVLEPRDDRHKEIPNHHCSSARHACCDIVILDFLSNCITKVSRKIAHDLFIIQFLLCFSNSVKTAQEFRFRFMAGIHHILKPCKL